MPSTQLLHRHRAADRRALALLVSIAAAMLVLGGCTSIAVQHMPNADTLPLVDEPGLPALISSHAPLSNGHVSNKAPSAAGI